MSAPVGALEETSQPSWTFLSARAAFHAILSGGSFFPSTFLVPSCLRCSARFDLRGNRRAFVRDIEWFFPWAGREVLVESPMTST